MIHLMMSAMSVGAFKSWVHVPSSGVVSFALKSGSSSGVALINGTKYRELSFPA